MYLIKCYYFLFWFFSTLKGSHVYNWAFFAINSGILNSDCTDESHPLLIFRAKCTGPSAYDGRILDIGFTACHDMPSFDKGIRWHPSVYRDDCLKFNSFTFVLLHLLHEVPIPKGIVPILNFYNWRFNIKWEWIFYFILLGLSAHILIGNVSRPADSPDEFVKFHLICLVRNSIKNH